MQKHVEGLGDAGGRHGVALDDGLVCARASGNVVGLDGEDLLQDIGCSECLEGPYLHLSETLASELCLTSQRLLGDEGVAM